MLKTARCLPRTSLFVAGLLIAGLGAAHAQERWVGTWATSPMEARNNGTTIGGEHGVTMRQIAHVSIGGSKVRVTLSNEFGDQPLTISSAAIANRAQGSAIAGSSVPLMFGGRASK